MPYFTLFPHIADYVVRTGDGLCQGNGSRNLAVLNLKKGDKVIVNTVCPLYSVANGTGETLVGENCEFIVENDGAFGFTMSKRNFPNSERSPFLFCKKKGCFNGC